MSRQSILRSGTTRSSHLTLYVLTLIAAATASLAPGASTASAKTQLTISGKLSRSGYTVMAIGYNGKVTSTGKKAFKLRLPDKRVTLQLIGPRGKYAGPVVVGYRGGKAIVGVRAGAQLGNVEVLNGYAVVAGSVRKKWVDSARTALTKKKVPIGNGRNFGFVRSSRRNGPSGNGGDTDLDGVPNILDVAADGTLVLNPLQSSGTGSTQSPVRALARSLATLFDDTTPSTSPSSSPTSSPSTPPVNPNPWMSQIFLDIPSTLNADAAGVTRDQIDSMLRNNLNIKYLQVPDGDLVQLDCNGLVYCSPGGTGQAATNTGAATADQLGATEAFPSCCTTGADGLGVLRGPNAASLANGKEFSLFPRATSEQIGTGDLMTTLVTSGGATAQTPAPLDFVFNTVPALHSYDDGIGNSAAISYPASTGASGTHENPAPVAAGSDGHVVLRLSWWRPQRAGIAGAGEPSFMDVGHLVYSLDMPPQGGSSAPVGSPQCSAASLSTTDPSLTLKTRQDPSEVVGSFVDSSDDLPADSSHLLSASVDLTQCLEDKGSSLPVGATAQIEIEAASQGSSDHANQVILFRRVS